MARDLLACGALAILLVPGLAAAVPPSFMIPGELAMDLVPSSLTQVQQLAAELTGRAGQVGDLAGATGDEHVRALAARLRAVFVDVDRLASAALAAGAGAGPTLMQAVVGLLLHAKEGLEALALSMLAGVVEAFNGTLGSICLRLDVGGGLRATMDYALETLTVLLQLANRHAQLLEDAVDASLAAAPGAADDPAAALRPWAAIGEHLAEDLPAEASDALDRLDEKLYEGWCAEVGFGGWSGVPHRAVQGAALLSAVLVHDARRVADAAHALLPPA